MKKIIGGKRYDSQTATEVHYTELWDESEEEDFQETMYRSPNGQLFIVRSNMSDQDIDLWLLNRYEATAWLEKCKAPEESYEAAEIEVERANRLR